MKGSLLSLLWLAVLVHGQTETPLELPCPLGTIPMPIVIGSCDPSTCLRGDCHNQTGSPIAHCCLTFDQLCPGDLTPMANNLTNCSEDECRAQQGTCELPPVVGQGGPEKICCIPPDESSPCSDFSNLQSAFTRCDFDIIDCKDARDFLECLTQDMDVDMDVCWQDIMKQNGANIEANSEDLDLNRCIIGDYKKNPAAKEFIFKFSKAYDVLNNKAKKKAVKRAIKGNIESAIDKRLTVQEISFSKGSIIVTVLMTPTNGTDGNQFEADLRLLAAMIENGTLTFEVDGELWTPTVGSVEVTEPQNDDVNKRHDDKGGNKAVVPAVVTTIVTEPQNDDVNKRHDDKGGNKAVVPAVVTTIVIIVVIAAAAATYIYFVRGERRLPCLKRSRDKYINNQESNPTYQGYNST